MYKYIASGIIFLCICYVGYSLKSMYRKKYNFYCDFSLFNQKLLDEINNYKTPIVKVIEKYIAENQNYVAKVLEAYKQNLQNNIIYVENSKEVIPKALFLAKDEVSFVINYLDNLGKTDFDTQVIFLKRHITEFEQKKNNSKVEMDKKGDLYFKLSIMLGFSIILIMI